MEYSRGRALQGLARFDEARAAYQAVIDAAKGGDLAARAQLMRGETFFHQKAYREALREFLKVDILYDAPRWQAAALLEAGKVHEQLDQWADAAETYQKLVVQVPRRPPRRRGQDPARRGSPTRGERGRGLGRPTSPEKEGGGPGLPRFSCILGPIV